MAKTHSKGEYGAYNAETKITKGKKRFVKKVQTNWNKATSTIDQND
jgi:hypothetical protein